jgi:hypothetical protein
VGAFPVGRESRPDPIQPGPTRPESVGRARPTGSSSSPWSRETSTSAGIRSRAGRAVAAPSSAGLRRPALSLVRMVYWTISKPDTREDRS